MTSSKGIYRIAMRVSDRSAQVVRVVKKALNINVSYAYNNFVIKLPADHLLPDYRISHKLYDRFLPHMAQYLSKGDVVVDVGANCGDTLAGMCDVNPTLKFICIEPDDAFFDLLQENTAKIISVYPGIDITLINKFVGKSVSNVVLAGSNGTKKAIRIDGAQAIKAVSLDDILSNAGIDSVRLIKSDVDGFDYDVIESGNIYLSKCSPIIYFECQLDEPYQKDRFCSLIDNIDIVCGYHNFAIFDNFGELIVTTRDRQVIYQFIEYVWKQNILRTTRTIYLYDILAFKDIDATLVSSVINDYVSY